MRPDTGEYKRTGGCVEKLELAAPVLKKRKR